MKTDKSTKKPGTVKTGSRQQPDPKTGSQQAASTKPAPGYKAPGANK